MNLVEERLLSKTTAVSSKQKDFMMCVLALGLLLKVFQILHLKYDMKNSAFMQSCTISYV